MRNIEIIINKFIYTEEAAEGSEWFALPSMIDEEGEASAEVVSDLVESFCFLR